MLSLVAFVLLAGSEAPERPVISVLYFDNNSTNADLDVMRKGLADMMVTDLVAWDGVTVVERDKLEAVLKELELQHSKKFDPGTAVKVGKLIGAQYTLTGAMALQGSTLRLDAKLVSVKDSTTAATASTTGDKDKIFDLEQELVSRITTAIDAKLKDPSARKKARVPDLDALLAYSKALELSDQGKVDEAQAAMQALVSKSPTFLMARERKQQLLQKLKEFEQRRKDMTTDSVLQLGRLADATLAQGSKLETLDDQAKARYLAMRVIKGRFILRAGKQFFSSRDGSLRVILKGKEAPALNVMRLWLENQRRLIDELARARSTRLDVEPEVEKLAREAQFGDFRSANQPLRPLVEFVLHGRADDGQGFTVAPALGDLDPNEQKAAFDLLDRQIAAALAAQAKAVTPNEQTRWEHEAIGFLDDKAEALLRLDRDEDAIAALQKILDQFPSSSSATRAETKIKKLLGAEHDNSRDKQERWAKALTTCDDMDIRVGMDTLHRKLQRMGLLALAAQAAELEKACKPNPKNRDAFAYVYKDLALTAGKHDDCDGFRSWFGRYVEAGGSVGDMLGYQKNWVPWCELGDVTKSVLWLTARLDRHWSFECDRDQRSQGDARKLVISSSGCGRGDTFSLSFAGPVCERATWVHEGKAVTGTCEASFSQTASQKGEYDEGTFKASFADEHKTQLTDGKFRVRRQ